MTDQEILHSPFNMEIHKKTFIHYLEVVILEDGTVEYAVPSHNKKLEDICCKRLGINTDRYEYTTNAKLLDDFKTKYGNNWYEWGDYLFETSKAICVWSNMYKGKPNEKQLEKLKALKDYGLYEGEIK